jgi:hypothetical protein
MDWHPAPGKRFVGVRLGAVDCVDRTEIITSGTTSVVLHNCKYALVTRRQHEGDHERQALQAEPTLWVTSGGLGPTLRRQVDPRQRTPPAPKGNQLARAPDTPARRRKNPTSDSLQGEFVLSAEVHLIWC